MQGVLIRHSTVEAASFGAVFASAPDAYLVLAADPPTFTMVAANKARLELTMTQREDVVGHPLFDVFPDNPADPAASGVANLMASLNEVIRTGKPHQMAIQKYDIRTPEGGFEERYWDPLNSPVLDDDGTLIYIIHRVRDVTEQVRQSQEHAEEKKARKEVESILARCVRSEEALRESEQRYRLLTDMIPQNIWTADANGQHTYFSKRWYDFSSATHDESRGEGWLDFIHPDDKERTLARWNHSLKTGEPYSIEYRFRGSDGAYRWFLGKAMPLRNDAGEIVEWFGTATDISERKELEEERERLSESRTRLMRGFSHDVKNPLGAADGYAALLEEGIRGPLSESQLQSVKRIRASIQVSLRLINDLLELARAEAGQIELRKERIDVSALTREIAEDFRGQVNAAGLSLDVVAAENLTVQSDPTRVRQILSNLLSNAVKYTREGSVTVTANRKSGYDATRSGEWIAVSVSDTGPGIPADKKQTIFQEFTRLDPNAPHGAGVGLAISRRIARLLGAEITVESEEGRGSTFTLWLPA